MRCQLSPAGAAEFTRVSRVAQLPGPKKMAGRSRQRRGAGSFEEDGVSQLWAPYHPDAPSKGLAREEDEAKGRAFFRS